MTHAELLKRISSRELVEWAAYFTWQAEEEEKAHRQHPGVI